MGVIAKLEAAEAKAKAAILKGLVEAAEVTDKTIVPDAEKLEPFIAALMNAACPGSGTAAETAENCLLALAKVIDAGGAAAESNLANLGLDTALIGAVKTLVPSLKAASKT